MTNEKQIGPIRAVSSDGNARQAWLELHIDGNHAEAIAAGWSWECGPHAVRFNGPRQAMIDVLKFWLNQIGEGSYE